MLVVFLLFLSEYPTHDVGFCLLETQRLKAGAARSAPTSPLISEGETYGVRLLLLSICGVKEEVVAGCFSIFSFRISHT